MCITDWDATIENISGTDYLISGVFNDTNAVFKVYRTSVQDLKTVYTSKEGPGCDFISVSSRELI